MVLIVANHDALRVVLHDWLAERMPELTVLSVSRVSKALDIVNRIGVDAVLLDVGIRGLNGIKAAHLIHARAPTVPVVILTTMNDRAQVASAPDADVIALVSRRKLFQELPRVLQAVLRQKAGSAGVPEAGAVGRGVA